eukprot:TRINITY_DN34969_c0_g1_i1.p2 TRINITY_DN34969_c0_g1~~TRINITY_DN34969_c0_g1_i1.p2  ORF type:complete len:111 (-),score=8.87 TRINITY_DN34969_c0_g1_i1:167-499(-)
MYFFYLLQMATFCSVHICAQQIINNQQQQSHFCKVRECVQEFDQCYDTYTTKKIFQFIFHVVLYCILQQMQNYLHELPLSFASLILQQFLSSQIKLSDQGFEQEDFERDL